MQINIFLVYFCFLLIYNDSVLTIVYNRMKITKLEEQMAEKKSGMFIVINRKHLPMEYNNQIRGVEALEDAIADLDIPKHQYYVCNHDEPYAEDVLKVILDGEDKKTLLDTVTLRSTARLDINCNFIKEGDYIRANISSSSTSILGQVRYDNEKCAFICTNITGYTFLHLLTSIEVLDNTEALGAKEDFLNSQMCANNICRKHAPRLLFGCEKFKYPSKELCAVFFSAAEEEAAEEAKEQAAEEAVKPEPPEEFCGRNICNKWNFLSPNGCGYFLDNLSNRCKKFTQRKVE